MTTKHKTIIATIVLSATLILNTAVFAQTGTAGQIDLTGKLGSVGQAAGFGTASQNTLPKTAGAIINGFLSILGIIFMAYIIYAGYLWLMASGREEQLVKAKAIIRGSIIGLIIVMSAYAITSFVIDQIIAATGYTK